MVAPSLKRRIYINILQIIVDKKAFSQVYLSTCYYKMNLDGNDFLNA